MNKLLLLFSLLLSYSSFYAQDDCPENLVCLSSITTSINEQNIVYVYDLLENGNNFSDCKNDSLILSYQISSLNGENITSFSEANLLDCSFTTGSYGFTVSKFQILPDGKLEEGTSCFGQIELVDLNDVCNGLNTNYDVNVIVDCSKTDVVGISGAFLTENKGQNVCVPFFAKNFIDMVGLQSGFEWNPNVLSYTQTQDAGLKDILVNEVNVSDGELKLIWLQDISIGELTLNDDDTLFELCFDLIGNAQEYSKVSMVGLENIPIELTKIQSEVKVSEYCISPAMVSINESNDAKKEFSATLNDQELDINLYNIVTVPGSLLVEGENTIKFQTIAFQDYLLNVSTLDLVLGLKMFVLDEPIDPIQAIALDVDYSGGINIKDLVLMRHLILGLRNDLPHPGKFFLRTGYDFPTDFDEFDFGYFDAFTFNTNEFNGGELFFKAYSYGDLSSIINLGGEEIEVRSRPEKLIYADKFVAAGDEELIKFELDGDNVFDINAVQGSLRFNDGKVVEVQHNYSDSEFLSHSSHEGVINFLYANLELRGKVEFQVLVKFESDGLLSSKISLREDFNVELVKGDLSTTKIELSSTKESVEEFRIAPNPFKDYTVLSIPKEYVGGKLSVTNILGRKIYNSLITQEELIVGSDEFSHSGVYLISVEKGNQSITKRVILH